MSQSTISKGQIRIDTTSKIRKFYKVQNACIKLRDSIRIIREIGLTPEELEYLLNSDDEINQTIGRSATMNIASQISQQQQSHFNVDKLFEKFKFDERRSEVDKYIQYPVIYDENLEHLVFVHKSFPNTNAHLSESERIKMSNQRLEFLGDSWLGAIISYILYKKYPTANEGTLSQMKEALVSNANLYEWSKKLNFNVRLQENIAEPTKIIKDKVSKRHADCVEAYIGALVLDRFSSEFLDLKEWLEELSTERLDTLHNIFAREHYNKNAKSELEDLLKVNKLGLKLNYKRRTCKSPFLIDVRIGDTILASAVGHSIREAEHRAAMKVLENDDLLMKYAAYEFTSNPTLNHNLQEFTLSNTKSGDEISPTHSLLERSPNEMYNDTNERNPSILKYIDNDNDVHNTLEKNLDNPSEQIIGQITNEILEKMNGTLNKIVTDIVSKTIREKTISRNDFAPDLSKSVKCKPIPNKTESSHLTSLNENHQIHLVDENRAKQTLYTAMTKVQIFPDYVTEKISMNEFHSKCVVKGSGIYLGEGTGRSKKIAQHMAAIAALGSTSLKNILKKSKEL